MDIDIYMENNVEADFVTQGKQTTVDVAEKWRR
jgi:hypothetical protein